MASLLEGDGELEGGNQFSGDQTIMAKCVVGVGSHNSREPCEETTGRLPLLPVPCPDGRSEGALAWGRKVC